MVACSITNEQLADQFSLPLKLNLNTKLEKPMVIVFVGVVGFLDEGLLETDTLLGLLGRKGQTLYV